MKKVLAMLLAVGMVFTLAACQKGEVSVDNAKGGGGGGPSVPVGSVPTAEELISNGMFGDVDSLDADIALHFEAKMSAEALSAGLPVSGSADLSMSVGVDAEVNLQSEGNVQHLSGDIGVSLLGFAYTEPMEQYIVELDDGTVRTYDKDSATNAWTYGTDSSSAAASVSDISGFANMDVSIIKNLTLQPVSEGDTVYTITGQVRAADALASSGSSMDDLFGSLGSTSVPEDMTFDLSVAYDRETLQLAGMMLELTPGTADMDEVEISSFLMSIQINSVNQIHVSVPQDVLDNALERMDWSDTDWEAEGWNDEWNDNPIHPAWNESPAAEV